MSNRRNLNLSGLLVGLCLCALVLFTARVDAQSTTTVTNVFQNHYHYGYSFGSNDCPTGYNIPSGQYPSTYHLERGHAIHHLDPQNATNDYWVYWAHFDNASYGVAEIAIFKSTTECGPYILQTGLSGQYNVDGGGYGFQPGGWQSRDDNIFRDSGTQTHNADGSVANYASSYLITASNDLGTQKSPSGSTCNYANDSVAIFKMTPDYLGIDATTSPSTSGANWAFVCAQREAPVMFQQGSSYFLITSQAAGWYPSQGGYGVSTNPLTGWTPSLIALGNTATFGGQTSDGIVVQGTQATTYLLTLDHLGGADTKSAASSEKTDTGEIWLPVILDGAKGTATLNWEPSFSVDNTTGVLTLPTLTNLATGAAASTTVTSTANPPALAIDGIYTTRWNGIATGSSSFNAAAPTTGTLCPVTNATSSTPCNPSLIVDVGSVQPIQQIDLSWYMVKGSEPYYTFKIAYSSDMVTWTTQDYTSLAPSSNAAANNLSIVPFSNNVTYGFNSLPVNFSARFVALLETGVVQQNSPSPFYGPGAYEMGIILSTAPPSPLSTIVTVTPSTSSTSASNSFTVVVDVAGPAGQPTPTGYVQFSASGYSSETYGLVNGTNSFTIPAGVLAGGTQSLMVSYRPDPTSAPIYGVGTTTGTANIYVDVPAPPTSVSLAQTSPGALTVSYTKASGASSYIVYRSADGGASFAQIGNPAATFFLDTGLNNDSTIYCYTVASVNAAGTGSRSSSVCGTATANFPVTGISVTPTAPDVLTGAYTAVANATGYIIKRSTAGGDYTQVGTPITTLYSDSGLTAGVNYCYTVAAVFSTGIGSDSAPVCGIATTDFPPSNLVVMPWASGALRLTWIAPANASSFTVKRSINGAAFTSLGTSTTPVYFDIGLTNSSIVYCYSVSAVVASVTSSDTPAVCNTATGSFLNVPNFSFETPVVPLWTTGPSALGSASWTFVGASGSSSGNNSGISNNSGTWTNHFPIPDGAQVAFLEGTGSVTQTISGFTAGQTYTILVAAEQRQTAQPSADPFKIVVNGASIGTFGPPQGVGYYRDYGTNFIATGTSTTVAFSGTSTSATSAVLLDNVRILAVPGNSLVINPQTATTTYGASNVTLTANATFGSSGPTDSLVFQVNGGTQIPGSCSISGSTQTCTISYPTSSLAAGSYTVNVSYEGDSNFAPGSASSTLTVSPASASVTPSPVAKVFGTGDPALGGTLLGFVASDGVVASYTRTVGETVGSYVISSTLSPSGVLGNYNITYNSAPFTITMAPTILTNLTVTPNPQQYSDLLSLSATTGSAPGVGGSVSFYISYGAATQHQLGSTQVVGPNGTASTANVPLVESVARSMAPGDYIVTALFTPADLVDYTGSSSTAAFTISKEDANLTYTGQRVLYTSSPSTSSITAPLTFTVEDSSAVPTTASVYDLNPGDIRNARFNILVDGVATAACSNLQPSLVTANSQVGTIGCNYLFSISGGHSGITPTITVLPDTASYYAPSSGDSTFTIVVSLLNPTNFLTGDGAFSNGGSAGTYAADAGTDTNFSLSVKYNKGKGSVQGNGSFTFSSHGHLYQINMDSILSLGITMTAQGGYGAIIAQADLQDVTDAQHPVPVEGNDSLTVIFHDNGSPGKNDTMAISVYSGSILRFASNWNGTSTAEQILHEGNLTVH